MKRSSGTFLCLTWVLMLGCGTSNGDADIGAGGGDLPDAPSVDSGRDAAESDTQGADVESADCQVGDAPVSLPDKPPDGIEFDSGGDILSDVSADTGMNACDVGPGDSIDDSLVFPAYSDCRPCRTTDDCEPGYECQSSRNGNVCLRKCVDDGDCMSGFNCWRDIGVCRPVSYDCPECVYDSECGDGDCCDFRTGSCKPCITQCQVCAKDYECMPGMRCYKADRYTAPVCVPECADGVCPDPEFQECVENGFGVKMCESDRTYCTTRCFSPTPFRLDDGTCVECLDAADCDAGLICGVPDHVCRDASSCAEGLVKCGSGDCRQCCADFDCLKFPESTGLCLTDGTCEGFDHCQGLCTVDFPVCAAVQGVWQCVQCVTDEDCALAGSNCSCAGDPIYSCVDPDGSICCH